MKKLISWLIRRDPDLNDADNWWILEETKHGKPPEERTGMYTYPQILQALRNKLSKWGGE